MAVLEGIEPSPLHRQCSVLAVRRQNQSENCWRLCVGVTHDPGRVPGVLQAGLAALPLLNYTAVANTTGLEPATSR